MQNINRSNFDLRALRILVAVAEGGSMIDVAAQFEVNQSSVSHTINKMREQLNDPLFYRVGRKVQPTKFLLDALPRFRAAILAMEALPKHADFEAETFNNRIVIAANVTELLPEIRKLYCTITQSAPLAQVHFIELGSRENLEHVLTSGKADLAIAVRMPLFPAALQSEVFLTDKYSIFFDPKMRSAIETLEDYAAARHAVLDFGGTSPSMVDRLLSRYGVRRKVVLGVPNVSCMAEFIRGNDFVCTMQTRLGQSVFSQLQSCPVPFETPQIYFDMAWHRRDEFDPKVAWLRQIIRNSGRLPD